MNAGKQFLTNTFDGQQGLTKKMSDPGPRGPGDVVEYDQISKDKSDDAVGGLGAKAQQVDLFFRFLSMDMTNAFKNFGYEFQIVDVRARRVIAKYNFPINPQNINVQVPSASVLEATMKGVYETHNGAPFRQIAISGTTGTVPVSNPLGSTSEAGSDTRRSIEYAFRNTIQAAGGVVNQVNRTVRAFSGATQRYEGPLNYRVEEMTANLTGYQSIHDLSRFLDFYLASKKLAENRAWRLYFVMHKDQCSYACSLNNYAISKAQGTTEYQYNINLTAYRRDSSTVPAVLRGLASAADARSSANTLSNALNGIRQARTAIAASHRVLAGIRADINESFITPLGEIVLMTKDLLGLALSMYDFAFSGETTRAMEESFKQYFTDKRLEQDMQRVSSIIGGLGLTGALAASGLPESAITTSAQDKLSSGKAEQFQQSEDSSDPVKVLFTTPEDYPEIFETFPIEDMNLPTEITDQIGSIVASTLEFTADDIIKRRDQITDFARSISEALGGGSSSYNAVKGLNSVRKSFKKLSTDDITLLSNLNDIIISMDRIISLMDQAETNDNEDYYKFYADYAVSEGLRFNQSNQSRFFVPFPVGGTLEQLAAQYLGTPDRWIEIAALNALKAPYVDEDGYFVTVTASSGGDTLSVADAESMYVGQVVEVMSDVERVTKRKIRSIDVVSAVETILTFENVPGKPLTAYKPSANARIRAFMPNTVNSDMLIAIPSDAPPAFDTTFKTSPEVDELDSIVRIAKVDFLLDSSGDVILTGGGDIRLAYGLTNLIQAAIMKVRTKTNQLLDKPYFGNPVDAGVNTADASAQDILQSITTSFQADPRFSGIIAGEVQKTGPATNVSILVGVKNMQLTLPVMAQLPR